MLGLPATDVRYIWHEIGLRHDHKHCNDASDQSVAIQREYPYCYNCLWSSIISQMFLFNIDSLYIKEVSRGLPITSGRVTKAQD